MLRPRSSARLAQLAAVMLGLWTLSAHAATDPRVAEGVALFDSGEFARARDALVTVASAPALAREDRVLARSYLAAAYHALGDAASAKAQLLMLAREHPDARLDSGTFLPELVALAEEARQEVAQEPRPPVPVRPRALPDSQQPAVADAPTSPAPNEVRLTAPPPLDTRPGLGLMFVPFGVGQFALDEHLKGTLFLTGEVLALGTSAVALAMFESNKIDGSFYGGGTFRDVELAETLQTVHLVAGYTGLALMVGGAIDALISRADHAPSGSGSGVGSAAVYSFSGQGLLIRF